MEFQQLRFDLYEIYARKFNSKIDSIKFEKKIKFNDLKSIGDSLFNELLTLENYFYNKDYTLEEKIFFWRPKLDSMLKANK